MNFGPILCQIPGNHIFTFTLKDGDTTIGTLPKTMTIGSVAMKEFQFINPPTTVVKDTDVSLTVQTLGTNDEPYPNYNKKFFILVEGDDDRTIPEA